MKFANGTVPLKKMHGRQWVLYYYRFKNVGLKKNEGRDTQKGAESIREPSVQQDVQNRTGSRM